MQAYEELIRKGDMAAVRAHLPTLRRDKIHREDLVTVAELSRRVGLHDIGLKVLRPVMHPASGRRASSNDREKAVYAALLIKIGAIEEAIGYLEHPNPEVPETLLYRGYAHVAQWDYPAAIPYLHNYSNLESVTEYQRITAQVNLAAALVFTEQFEQAEALLKTILRATRLNDWRLLHGGALEISARSAMGRKDWASASARLEEAERHYNSQSNAQLFVKKWKALMPLLRGDASAGDFHQVEILRNEAIKAKHWETIRDCDYHLALARSDQDLFSRVFFGTPFPRFRERMRKNREGFFIPSSYFWQCGGTGGRQFDVENGREMNGPAVLKPGQKLHLFTKALVQDFYRPSLLGNIHSKVFPGVHYDPVHSSRRISDLIRRLRQWFKENEIPLEIMVLDGAFRVHANGPIQLHLENPDLNLSDSSSIALETQLKSLHSFWPTEEFSTQAAADRLQISRRAANLLLARATEEGRIIRIGQGPTTRYRFIGQESE